MEVRGQFEEASSLLLPCGSQGLLNSGHQNWWQEPLPTDHLTGTCSFHFFNSSSYISAYMKQDGVLSNTLCLSVCRGQGCN